MCCLAWVGGALRRRPGLRCVALHAVSLQPLCFLASAHLPSPRRGPRLADRLPARLLVPFPAATLAIPQPTTDKRPRLDPKEAAKQKAADTRQAAKAAKLAKEAAGMRKLSAFFRPAAPK